MIIKAFGKIPKNERLDRIKKSPNYKDGAFQNMEHTDVMRKDVSFFTVVKKNLNKPKSVKPGKEIPHIKTNLFDQKSDTPSIIWFGHSSYLIQSNGLNILVDPVFSGNASPVNFLVKAFDGANNYSVENFPAIDILVLTHDHYDHLDYKTIVAIHPKVKMIITTLGVGSHLEFWGVDKNKINELDWWEEKLLLSEVHITATPSRHFSGRGIQRGKTIWSSFVLKIHGYKIFIGGDSGYDAQFKIIGEKFDGFDLAMLECGQYNENWPNIHMMPEETVKAAKDLNAKILFPVHWAKFALAVHPWNEPIKRLVIAAEKAGQQFVSPIIGEPYSIGKAHQQAIWWDFE